MAAKRKSYLQTLPAEILHRIFDHLNAETIIFSIRYVCKWLYYTTNTYNRFDLDFRYMSKSDIRFIARIIDPKNIISLTLSDEIQTPGQIRSFLNHVHINEFIRLRSLNLIKIESNDLDIFRNYIIKCPLTTLSIAPHIHYKDGPTALIISILSNNDLRKFEYIGYYNIFNKIQLPIQCRLQHLTISHANLHTVYSIIFHLPYLQTFIVKNVVSDHFDPINFTYPDILQSSHLNSLSLNLKYDISIDDIESVLLLLPMLTHLRLIGEEPLANLQLFNGSRWENFIQTKLSLLNRFEFWFTCRAPIDASYITVNSLIAPFRTSFWLEIKNWIVKCDYHDVKYSSRFHLYSIPIIRENFDYSEQQSMISHSMLNTADNNITIIINALQLSLNLSQMISENNSQLVSSIMTYRFPNVAELTLVINEKWFVDSVKHLSRIINLSNLQTLWLDFRCECKFAVSLHTEMSILLKRALNLRSLRISYNKSERMKMVILNSICLNLPHNIQRLDTDITHLNDAKMILERAKHLQIVTFRIIKPWQFAHEIDMWFWQMKRNVAYQVESIPLRRYDTCDPVDSVHLWLNRNMNKQSNISNNHKRFKRNHHSHYS